MNIPHIVITGTNYLYGDYSIIIYTGGQEQGQNFNYKSVYEVMYILLEINWQRGKPSNVVTN